MLQGVRPSGEEWDYLMREDSEHSYRDAGGSLSLAIDEELEVEEEIVSMSSPISNLPFYSNEESMTSKQLRVHACFLGH